MSSTTEARIRELKRSCSATAELEQAWKEIEHTALQLCTIENRMAWRREQGRPLLLFLRAEVKIFQKDFKLKRDRLTDLCVKNGIPSPHDLTARDIYRSLAH